MKILEGVLDVLKEKNVLNRQVLTKHFKLRYAF